MTGERLSRDQLGQLERIGQGGQGVVYRAPKVKTAFSASMVYKEYKDGALASVDFAALAAMPALVEDTMTYQQAERLISIAAWPCRLVEDRGIPTGFVMPVIPDAFFLPLTTAKGTTTVLAEFQHLLNHASVLAARGIDLTEIQRYALLRDAAAALSFLHTYGVCVGDISPKNLLFSLTPHEAVYLIDCDAMRVNGVSALTQVETPGWGAPAGEELATIYTDTYKLGLLALRLLVGDQDTTNLSHLPTQTPDLLRQIISDTLTSPPERRPLPQAWSYVLGHAIEYAQHQAKARPVVVETIAAPTQPVVKSRPSTTSKPPASSVPRAPVTAAAQSLPPSTYSSGRSGSRAAVALSMAVLVAVIAVVVIAVVVMHPGRGADSGTAAGSTAVAAGVPGAFPSGSCTGPAQVAATSLNLTAEGLSVGTSVQASCESGDVVSGSSVQMTVSDGSKDVASGVFDLDAHPISLTGGGQASQQFVFPAGMYWRTPELVSADNLTVTLSGAEHGGGAPGGSGPVTAVRPAGPAHGDIESTAGAALHELANADYASVKAGLADRWVPQISSKRVGLVTDGITYANADILRDHLALRQRYDNVRLVYSGSWSSFTGSTWWITVAGAPSDDAASANSWCDSHNIDSWNCFAKMISASQGPDGSTVMRR